MDFLVEGKKVVMTFSVQDVYQNTQFHKTHREFIQHVFKQHGYEVTKWNWDKDPDSSKWIHHPDGVQFMSSDRMVELYTEVHGIVGQNVRELHAT